MTLIVGAVHWKGVCLNADTRATNPNGPKFEDDWQKIAHVHGGVGMAASGHAYTAIAFREILIKHLNYLQSNKIGLSPGQTIEEYMKNAFEFALKKTPSHPGLKNLDKVDIFSKGLIGVNIPAQKLMINYEEANNLIEIILNSSNLNTIYSKYIEKIVWCANSKLNVVELEDFEHNVLYKYCIDYSRNLFNVERVPFGKIVAFGSGAEFDYEKISPRTMSWVLFSPESEDIENACFHLTSIQAYAEAEVDINYRYGFKTFGGGIIGAVIRNKEINGINMGETGILIGDYGLKKENRIICRTYLKENKVWIETKEGANLELKPFPEGLKTSKLLL